MAGRKTKLTPEKQEIIIKALRAGLSRERAAQLVQINDSTLFRWIERGRKQKKGIYCDFCKVLDYTEAEIELEALETIKRIGKGEQESTETKITTNEKGEVTETVTTKLSPDWRAIMTWLERRFPQWRKKDLHEITGEGGGPINYSNLTEEELTKRLVELLVEQLPYLPLNEDQKRKINQHLK